MHLHSISMNNMGNLKFLTKKEISKNIFLITAKNKIEINKYLIERIGLAASKKILNLLISGGNSLNSLLKELSLNHNLANKINFYLTDERLVKYNSRYSILKLTTNINALSL